MLTVAILCLWPALGMAQDRLVGLHAPEALVETGLLKHILPRFSLKTQVKVQLVPASDANMVLGAQGPALFEGAGQMWHMSVQTPDHAATERFADWLTSDVGRRTVTGFAPNGVALFTLPQETEPVALTAVATGDAIAGQALSRSKCARCHVVDDTTRWSGIGSTPSFAVLRSLADWEDRFAAFYALNPHPAFTIITDVTPPFPQDRPPAIVPVELTIDELEAVLAYVTAMSPADLGQPLSLQ